VADPPAGISRPAATRSGWVPAMRPATWPAGRLRSCCASDPR